VAITTRTGTVVEGNGGGSGQTSITGTLPTGTTTGDVVVATFALPGTTAQFTGPSGWTALHSPLNIASTTEVLASYYRVSPPGAPTASTSGAAGRCSVIVQSYVGVDNTTPIDVAAQTSTGTGSTTLAATGVTTVTAGAQVISAYMADTSSRTPIAPSGMTADGATAAAGGRCLGLASVNQGSAGASGSKTWTITSAVAVDMAAFVGALRPVTGPSFTGSSSSTVTASGSLTTGITGSGASTVTATGGTLQLGIGLTGTSASTVTAAGALSVISRVFTGVLEIELVAGSNTWTDFTPRLDFTSGALTIRQGRPTVFDDVGAAQLSTSLFNDDGNITPDNPAASTPLTEGMRIRWRVSKGGATYARFVGWISDVTPDFPGASTHGSRVSVTAVDALGLLGQRKLRSNWTERALSLARAAGVNCSAYEATGSANGMNPAFTNYSENPNLPGTNAVVTTGIPVMTVGSDRDMSVGGVVTSNPGGFSLDCSSSLVGIRTGSKSIYMLIKLPTTLVTANTNVGHFSDFLPVNYYAALMLIPNAGFHDLHVYDGNVTASLGVLKASAPFGQWVMVKLSQNGGNATRTDVSCVVLADGSTGSLTNLNFDIRNIGCVEIPGARAPLGAISVGGVLEFGSNISMDYNDSFVSGAQGALSSRLADLQAAVSRLPITWATVGSHTTQVVTGTWSGRTAVEVLQEMMRTNLLSVAWARSRDSVIYTIGSDTVRPLAPIATIDTDADCDGPPKLTRSQSTRPTRVQVDTSGISTLIVDQAAEAGPGNPERLRTVSTVCASDTDQKTIGGLVLAARTRLRITQMVVDLTTAVTDHTTELFSEAGALTGLFPTARVRAVVPLSHFGVATRDYWVQGWSESYSPQRVLVTLDTDPCTTATYVTEAFPGANGAAWSGTWTTTFGAGTSGATFDVQAGRGRVVSGAGGQAGKRIGAQVADVEITGSIVVTGGAEGQVWWRMDGGGANGYGLVFSASGGIRLQQAVAGVVSTRYNAAAVGGPAVVASTDYSFRIRHQGTRLSVRTWATASAEPTTWPLNVVDSLFTAAGYIGLAQWFASGTASFDNVTITDGA
jgi:hypothetical protein